MIHVDENKCLVTGPAMHVMAQTGLVIKNMADSLIRKGADPESVKGLMHRLVDISLSAPDSGPTIDLSFMKEG